MLYLQKKRVNVFTITLGGNYMLIKDITSTKYSYEHEFQYTISDNYEVDVWVCFSSFEIVDALKKDSRFKWSSDYDLMDEESFCKMFLDDFINLNEQLVAEVAEDSPEAYKAHW